MNKVILIGRIVRQPEVRYTNNTAIARYTLAVDRRFKKDGEPTADFINCVAFGKSGEFAEKYFNKGMKVAVTGRIQTGNYKDRDGRTVYTTDIVIEEQEFAESKQSQQTAPQKPKQEEWMSIPDGISEELPFM